MTSATELIDQINSLLDRERDALLAGEYAVLSDISQRQMVLLDRLESTMRSTAVNADLLHHLRNRGAENRRLIAGALGGLREARAVLGAGSRMRIYDQLGKPRFLGELK